MPVQHTLAAPGAVLGQMARCLSLIWFERTVTTSASTQR